MRAAPGAGGAPMAARLRMGPFLDNKRRSEKKGNKILKINIYFKINIFLELRM